MVAAQKQVHSLEGRALASEQAATALQQDVVNWQSRFKKKDSELAAQTAKVCIAKESSVWIDLLQLSSELFLPAAALQHDVANWQGRFKKKDTELAAQTARVCTAGKPY